MQCIRCNERQAFGDRGYCITCVWAVQLEVEQGLSKLQQYLQSWAAFGDWCSRHALPTV